MRNRSQPKVSIWPRLPLYRLLIALAAVLALVAPATVGRRAGRHREAAAAVEPAVVQITTTIDYQHAIGTGTGIVLDPAARC